jgi:hypothetical protein
MYQSLWGWFNNYEVNARLRGTPDMRKLPVTAYKGWELLRNIEPDLALDIFRDGLKLAHDLNEPMWELFFDLWCCEILVYHKSDMKAALDHTIRAVTRAHQPRYEPFPVIRSQLFFVLSNLYFMIDPFGYADDIRQLLDFTEASVPMAQDTHLRILSIRSALYFEHREYEKAQESTLEYLALAEGNARRMAGAHERLAGLAYASGDVALALKHSEQHEELSEYEDDKDDIALAHLWQAVYLQHQGAETAARQKHVQGEWDFARMAYVKRASYYDSMCAYLELTNNADEALTLRREQIQAEHHSIAHTAKAHLQYCCLLGRMGCELGTALAIARCLIPEMRKSQWFERALLQIERGEYYEFDWQKS